MFCTVLQFGTNSLTVSASRGSCASDDLCRCRVPVGLETKLADLGARKSSKIKAGMPLYLSLMLQFKQQKVNPPAASFKRRDCKLQRVFCLGSVTARHSSIERQPNFAPLNRGRHLYSAGRPSRWALAHILVIGVAM